jgi:inosine-uridine nucleoside N-ribohydrolase
MTRKLIVDGDMGTDDAVALCMLLFDSRIELLGLTAVEGCVTAEQANHNLQAIISELDPARHPRLGLAQSAAGAPPITGRHLYGEDGLGNTHFEIQSKQHLLPSEKLIIDLVRKSPGEVSILCLGPLTNLARAIQRDPAIETMVDRVVMVGGSVQGVGNVTPTAEFNFYFDPDSARSVLRSKLTRTLVPLDVTRQVSFGLEMLNELPSESTRSGLFLRQVLPFAFRAYRQQLGHETITLNDAVGALAVCEPELFQFEDMAGDVETEGELTRGMTVFDRRVPQEWRSNLEVAVSLRVEAARQYLLDQLQVAGRATSF